jgi:hypothetical protein
MRAWLASGVEKLAAPAAPLYASSVCAFAPTIVDVMHFGALTKMVGAAGTRAMQGVLLDAAGSKCAGLRQMLRANVEPLAAFAKHFERTRQMPQLTLDDLEGGLDACHGLGVVLAVRHLLMAGAAEGKAELLPGAVPAFARSLGEQQLPSGERAGGRLGEVAALLVEFGLPGGLERDLELQQVIGKACGVAEDGPLWALLPYALALTFSLPTWEAVTPQLTADALPANYHTMAFALHALLAMAETVTPRRADAAGPPKGAHQTFIEVASLVILQRRQSADGQPAGSKERGITAMLLLLDQFVALAASAGLNRGDMQPFLPHALVCAQYAETWHRSLGDLTSVQLDEQAGA